MSFDLKSLQEFHNISPADNKIRSALYGCANPTSGSLYVGGFSVEAANTGALYHYVLERATATGIGTMLVLNEQFQTISSLVIGYIPKVVDLTYALQSRQLLISAPQFSYTLYSIVGGGITRAVKTESITPTTTTLSVPVGMCCSFGDRIVIAEGSRLYFNDPGIDPRTYVAENIVALPAKVVDMFEGPQGALIIGTTDGVYALPSDALGQGQLVFGFLSKISSYQCQQFRNLVYANGSIVGLSRRGYVAIADGAEEVNPAPYCGKRYYSVVVGPGDNGDYRSYKMFATRDYGHLISAKNNLYSIKKGMWITSGEDLNTVGVLKNSNGGDLIMTPSFVLDTWGNVEVDTEDYVGVVCGSLPANITDSTMVRAIITSCDNISHNQAAYIGGTADSMVTPAPERALNIIGTDAWSATNKYCNPEIRSRRHQVALRTDEISFEVSFDEANSNVGQIDVQTVPSGPKRPTN